MKLRKLLVVLALLVPGVSWCQIKISQLPAGTTPTGVELFPAVQSSNTVSLTLNQVVALTITNLNATTIGNLWSGCSTLTALFYGGVCQQVVQSIAVGTMPTGFTASVSQAGNIWTTNISYTAGQSANQFLATPNGGSGPLGLRTIVGSDIPATNLASNANGGVTGILQASNGGCGTSTLLACITALLPAQTGFNGYALTTNGSGTLSWQNSTVTQTSGTFATQISGCSSGGSGTLHYNKTGNIASIYSNGTISCNGSATTANFTMNSVPAAINPTNSQIVPCMMILAAATTGISGYCQVSANTITVWTAVWNSAFIVQGSLSSGYFASGVTRGIAAGFSLTYPLQ